MIKSLCFHEIGPLLCKHFIFHIVSDLDVINLYKYSSNKILATQNISFTKSIHFHGLSRHLLIFAF
jgi:hypothetical protein